jgi:hypothetical protein
MTPDAQVALTVGIIAGVAALGGAAIGLFGTLIVWKLQRAAEKADRVENFQRENLLRLQDLLQDYFAATAKWIASGRHADLAEPWYRTRIAIDDCRARSSDSALRALLKTLSEAEPPKNPPLDNEALMRIYIAPCTPVRDRIDALLQT